MSPTPSGMTNSPSGTSPLIRQSILSSMKTTGLSSRIAAFSNPFASRGVDGSTTLRPGTWATHAWRLWLCCAADLRVAPSVVRSTSGTISFPPDM